MIAGISQVKVLAMWPGSTLGMAWYLIFCADLPSINVSPVDVVLWSKYGVMCHLHGI